MLIKFNNNTFIEKPPGAKLVGLKRDGFRPTSIELDYYDLDQILKSDHKDRYLVHLWKCLAPDYRIKFLGIKHETNV